MCELIRELYEGIKVAEQQLRRYDVLVTNVVEQDDRCQHLSKVLSDRQSTLYLQIGVCR